MLYVSFLLWRLRRNEIDLQDVIIIWTMFQVLDWYHDISDDFSLFLLFLGGIPYYLFLFQHCVNSYSCLLDLFSLFFICQFFCSFSLSFSILQKLSRPLFSLQEKSKIYKWITCMFPCLETLSSTEPTSLCHCITPFDLGRMSSGYRGNHHY